jgi:predicted ester cyclase
MTATRNDRRKAMLTGFLNDVWSSGDIERSDAYLAEAYTIHHDPGDPRQGQALGLEGFKARVALSRAPFPDLQFLVREMIADAGKVVATWLWPATKEATSPAFPRREGAQDVGSHVYYLDDQDRITGHWQTADRLGLYQQLQRARGA